VTEKSDAIRDVIEGLAYANRPLFAAANDVKQKYGLGPRGAFILNLVSEGMDYPNQLATKLGTSRSLISADIGRLTEAGLLAGTTGTGDKRTMRLSLTPEGARVCEAIRTKMASLITRNLSAYSARDIKLFAAMLHDARRV
jgi:DNA-binding MarR family transcriptional regulator